jgi:hypothetical protein
VVDNPSFETAVAPWTLWVGAGGNSDGLERDPVGAAPDGSYALAVKGFGTGGKGAFEYIANNWVNNRQYRLNVYVRNLANNGIRYAIGYATGNPGAAGAGGAIYGPEVAGTSSWQLASVTFTCTNADQGVTLYLKAVNAGASERAGFDKVFIEDLTPVGPPVIARSPASLARTVVQGGTLPADSFIVQNTGGGTLDYSITDNASWLSVNPASGVSTGEVDPISINYSTAGLGLGTYTATITISAAGAGNSPQTIGVTVTVKPPAIPGDFDGDGDVDQSDFGYLQKCLTGPGLAVVDPACDGARLDADDDVDSEDMVLFSGCMSGAGKDGDPDCAP